ncbi:MAG: ShlB/FhaC/HecB family hemolysin secretion/activation protein [Limnobacter sp.]|nr:ShlB/FhaC/HecB family hemolysin secretion/activation protein [Limnobacter sp.]
MAQVSATTPQTPSSVLGTQQLESQSGKSILEPSAAELPQVPVQPKPELAKPLEDVRVAVNQFSVQGVPDQYLPSIHKALVPFLGEQRSFEDLSNAATQVARVLQSEFGLYLAYAYLPAQQINGGTVIIQVLPGYLEEVVLQWPEGDFPVDREVVEAHLAALKPGQVIRVSEVERVVFLLNDLRGMRATFTIQPG